MAKAKTIQRRVAETLRAGQLVIVVKDNDFQRARASIRRGVSAFLRRDPSQSLDRDLSPEEYKEIAPGMTISEEIASHRENGTGVILIPSLISLFGHNKMMSFLLAEFARVVKKSTPPFPRLIILEQEFVQVPDELKPDVSTIVGGPADMTSLEHEVKVFVEQQRENLAEVPDDSTITTIATRCQGLHGHEAAKVLSESLVVNSGRLDPLWIGEAKARRIEESFGGALQIVSSEGAEIGGQAGLKSWLQDRSRAICSPEARAYGLPEPKGVLLTGIPGTGKSACVKAIARSLGLVLVRLDIGKLYGSLVGQSESNTRHALRTAEAFAPEVLWLEELDKGAAGTKEGGGDGGTTKRVLGSILTWLQEKEKPIFVVATANRVQDLPPELLRKGRFDEIFFVDLPSEKERAEIIDIHLRMRGRDPEKFSVQDIVAATSGFSGSEIEQAILEGMYRSFHTNREVRTEDIVRAARMTRPLSVTMKSDVDSLRAWAAQSARNAAGDTEPAGPARTAHPTTGRVRGEIIADDLD